MRRYLLLSILAVFVTSCTLGRGGDPHSTAPPPRPAATKKTAAATRTSSVAQITDGNYEELIRSHKVVLILFWAEWSAPDRAITPIVDALSNEYSGRVKTGKANVDDNPRITQKFGIKGIPTLVVIKDGSEQERLVGLAPKQKITDLLDKQLSQ